MRIEGLGKYQRRHVEGYFQDLPSHIRALACERLKRFRARWGRNMPPWRLAILVAQARRLALHPPTSAWGRSMRAKRGGYAVQREYRAEGRNPTLKATYARLVRQGHRDSAQQFLQRSRGRTPYGVAASGGWPKTPSLPRAPASPPLDTTAAGVGRSQEQEPGRRLEPARSVTVGCGLRPPWLLVEPPKRR